MSDGLAVRWLESMRRCRSHVEPLFPIMSGGFLRFFVVVMVPFDVETGFWRGLLSALTMPLATLPGPVHNESACGIAER